MKDIETATHTLVFLLFVASCGADDSKINADANDAGPSTDSATDGPGTNESGPPSDTPSDSPSDSPLDTPSDAPSDTPDDSSSVARHDICADIGDTFGMGAAIYGDVGTTWYLTGAEAPSNIDWLSGYMYTSADPHEDLEGFEWIVSYRLDTAEQGGSTIPTVTFYRMLNVGQAYGYSGTEAQIVQQMLQDGDAVRDYLDDFIAVLEILYRRDTPTLVHVEPDSWGFMMWAFDGIDSTTGNGSAEGIPVALSKANHSALTSISLPDHAGGLGRALLHLRDTIAPELRMGWHASNFRVGTSPEVVTSFYSSMGHWDVIVTEPPHMVNSGANPWDMSQADNSNNRNWFEHMSGQTGLPIIIWQTFAMETTPYFGNWPEDTTNLERFAQWGVAAILWDPNSEGCGYNCAEADDLLTALKQYSSAPLTFPEGSICRL